MVQIERRIDRGMVPATTRIRLEAQLCPSKRGPEFSRNRFQVVALRLIHGEKATAASEDLLRPGKSLPSQQDREHRAARRLSGLEALGQRPVENALAIASSLTVGNTEGVDHLLDIQP